MKELHLIRHGHSQYAGDRYIGKTDTPLTEQGVEQARSVCRRLETLPFEALYCSPALRARETLKPLLDKDPSRPLVVLSDLQEVDFGQWEGLSFSEIQSHSPGLIAGWVSGSREFTFPGGESLETFWQRVCQVGERLLAGEEKMVAVVTHAGVIRYLLCHFLGIPPEQHRIFQIDPGSLTTLTFSDGFAVLKGLNAHG
jgi:broad specificity phosphatase PhoE